MAGESSDFLGIVSGSVVLAVCRKVLQSHGHPGGPLEKQLPPPRELEALGQQRPGVSSYWDGL